MRLAVSRRRRRAAAGGGGARAARARHGQDAAVRQQERVPGDGRYAGGHALETHGACRLGARRRRRWRTRPSSTCRATSARRRRTTSTGWCVTTFCAAAPHLADLQVNLVAEGRAQRAEPRHRASACATGCCRSPRRSARRSRWPKCRRGRRCCRRSSPKSTDRMPRGGWSSPRRSRPIFEQTPGVVDVDWYVEAPQPKSHARRGRREGRRRRTVVGRRGVGRPDGRLGRRRRPAARCAGARRRPDRPAPAARRAQRSTRCSRCG